MICRRPVVTLVACVFQAVTFGAPAPAVENATLTDIVGLKGKCAALALPSGDMTASCTGNLLNMAYTNGRTGFYFILSDGLAVDFSGDGTKQTKIDADIIVQPVDLVLYGKPVKTMTAAGSCRYTNPFKGKATIDCQAQTPNGYFRAMFESDGGKPDVRKM